MFTALRKVTSYSLVYMFNVSKNFLPPVSGQKLRIGAVISSEAFVNWHLLPRRPQKSYILPTIFSAIIVILRKKWLFFPDEALNNLQLVQFVSFRCVYVQGIRPQLGYVFLSRQQVGLCTAEAIRARVFKHLHFRGLSSVRIWQHSALLFLLLVLEFNTVLSSRPKESTDFYNSPAIQTILLSFQF